MSDSEINTPCNNAGLQAYVNHSDELREECGVFGIFGHPDAATITTLGLHALQHRGQEAAGIVCSMESSFSQRGEWD